MTRLEILKKELEQIKQFQTLSYELKEKAIEWYEHEIMVIEEYGE